ncbi:MAG TPA: hypothetical protein VGV92_01835 [Gammaproteobacteria bacterium]|nr:hypothetical protein [Gammaproteobacteria bacterium]
MTDEKKETDEREMNAIVDQIQGSFNTLETLLTLLSNDQNPLDDSDITSRSQHYQGVQHAAKHLFDHPINNDEIIRRSAWIEYVIHGALYLYSQHCLILRAQPQDQKTKARELFLLLRTFIAELQRNPGKTVEEKVLTHKLTIFSRALLTQTAIVAALAPPHIMFAVMAYFYDAEKYVNFIRLSASDSAQSIILSSRRLNSFIQKITTQFIQHISTQSADFSRYDNMFIYYIKTCSQSDFTIISPTTFANSLLSFDFTEFKQQLPRVIATSLLAAKPLRHEAVTHAAQILCKIRFVLLQLTGIFNGKEDVISAELRSALVKRFNEVSPLLSAYCYFTGSAEFEFFLGKASAPNVNATIVDETAHLINVSRNFSGLSDFHTMCTFFMICKKSPKNKDVVNVLHAFTKNSVAYLCELELGCIEKIDTPDNIMCLIDHFEERQRLNPDQKLGDKVYASLILFLSYRRLTLDTERTKDEIKDFIALAREHVDVMEADDTLTDPTEKLLTQTMRVFSLTLIAQAMVLSKQSPLRVMSAVTHFLCECGAQENLTIRERLLAKGDAQRTTQLELGFALSNQWDPWITDSMSYLTTHVQQSRTSSNISTFSDSDKSLICYIDTCARLPVKINAAIIPTFIQTFVSTLLKFDFPAFAQKLRAGIANALLDRPQDPTLPEDMLTIGQLLIVHLQLTGLFFGKKYVAKKDEDEIVKKLEEFLPLINAYRYFLRLNAFHFINAALVIHSSETRERHVAFNLLAQIAVLTDPQKRSDKINNLCKVIAPTAVLATNASLALMCFATEEAEKGLLPEIPTLGETTGNQHLIAAISVLAALFHEPSEEIRTRETKFYLLKIARDLSALKKDFNTMATFFLICKKALAFEESTFKSGVTKLLTAVAENKPRVTIFEEKRSVNDVLAGMEKKPVLNKTLRIGAYNASTMQEPTVNTKAELEELVNLATRPKGISGTQIAENTQALKRLSGFYQDKTKTTQNKNNSLVYASLAACANYFLFLGDRSTGATWLEECETLSTQLKKMSGQQAFTANTALFQSLHIFLLVNKTHVLMLLEKDRASVMQTFEHFCTELQIYMKLIADKKLNKTELRNGIELAKPWAIYTLSQMQTHYTKLLNNLATLKTEHEKSLDTTLAQKIRTAISQLFLSPTTEKTLDVFIEAQARHVAELWSLKAEWSRLLTLIVKINPSAKIPAELSRAYDDLQKKLEELLPLLDLYRYFFNPVSDPLPFLNEVKVVIEKMTEAQYRAWFFHKFMEHKNTPREKFEAFHEENGKIARGINTNPAHKIVCLGFLRERLLIAEKKSGDKVYVPPHLVNARDVFCADMNTDAVNLKNMKYYFAQIAKDLSEINKDFNIMSTFFLICKRAFALKDESLNIEVRKILTAYLAGKKSVAVFVQEDTAQEAAEKVEPKPAPQKKKKKKKSPANAKPRVQAKAAPEEEAPAEETPVGEEVLSEEVVSEEVVVEETPAEEISSEEEAPLPANTQSKKTAKKKPYRQNKAKKPQAKTSAPFVVKEPVGLRKPTAPPANEMPPPNPYDEPPAPAAVVVQPPQLLSLLQYLDRVQTWISAEETLNCPAAENIVETFNALCRAEMGFNYFSCVTGGANRDIIMGETPKDFDITIIGSAGEVMDVLKANWERLDIAHIEANKEGHFFYTVTFNHAPGVIVEITPIDITKIFEIATAIGLHPSRLHLDLLLNELQKRLDYNLNSIMRTQINGRRLMRDPYKAHAELKSAEPILDRIPGYIQPDRNIPTIMMRGALLIQKRSKIKASPTLLAQYHADNVRLSHPGAQRTFSKLLYTENAHDALLALHAQGFLKRLFPQVIPVLENPEFKIWVDKFLTEKGPGLRERARISQDEFEKVQSEVKTEYCSAIFRLKNKDFSFKQPNNGRKSPLLFQPEETQEDAQEISHAILPPTTNIGSPTNGNGN